MNTTVLRVHSLAIAIALILGAVGLPGVAVAATTGIVRGSVLDGTGTPLPGALVLVTGVRPTLTDRTAVTDKNGLFFLQDVPAGRYSIQVTMAGFLRGQKRDIDLAAGTQASMTLHLRTALDIVQNQIQKVQPDEDMIWILRSSRAAQPGLWLVTHTDSELGALAAASPSGYVSVYSNPSELPGRMLDDSFGSQFSVTMPVRGRSKITVAGQFGQSTDRPSGVGAAYEFSPMERHLAKVGVNVRQSVLSGFHQQYDQALREVQVQYTERFQMSDHFVFTFGGEAGRSDAPSDRTYVRPHFGFTWVPESRTTIGLAASAQSPSAADDPVRGTEYLDRSIQVPPTLQQYFHSEVNVSRTFSDDARVTVTVFRDEANTQAILVGSPNGPRRAMVFDTRGIPSEGIRVYVNRDFDGFSAGIGYTNVSGIGIEASPIFWRPEAGRLVPQRFHVITARIHKTVNVTNTQFTAVYRWISDFSATPIDAYQGDVEYSEPTLTLTMAQDLPGWGSFPGKIQAIVDVRNLFEQSVRSGKYQLLQSPRFIKGGFAIRF